MRWIPGGRSGNIEDQRGSPTFGRGGVVGLGLGGTLVVLALSVVFGRDFLGLLETTERSTSVDSPVQDASEEQLVQFVSFVLDDAQGTWRQILPASGTSYRDAKLVLFRDAVGSACGFAEAASGPFYCPSDERIYLDLSFFDELHSRFGASGDFAQAYIVAHEIGHHLQKLLGIAERVRSAQGSNQGNANALSVRLELQADCFAGAWGHSTAQRDILERGDVEEGLNAAAAIGDDRLQKMARGTVSPESFTHGSSAQRVAWFQRGLESGGISACDTFNAASL